MPSPRSLGLALLFVIVLLPSIVLANTNSTTSSCSFDNAVVNSTSQLIKTASPLGTVYEVYPSSARICSSSWFTPIAVTMVPIELRAVLYLAGLLYCFLGVAIVADVFMSAIEHITSKTRVIRRVDKDGNVHETTAYFWNPTVANLTLMALGSSAPEILLAVFETVSNLGRPAGELGPGTIVGSAAFNLLAITAICVYSIPDGQVRRIKDVGVFFITATFSVLAYLWLCVVLLYWTPDEVTLEEALITLGLFPVLVALAYAQDRSWWRRKPTRVAPAAPADSDDDTHPVLAGTDAGSANAAAHHGDDDDDDDDAKDSLSPSILNVNWRTADNMDQVITKEQLEGVLRNLQASHQIKDVTDPTTVQRLGDAIFNQNGASRAVYHSNAIRALTGQRRVISTKTDSHERQEAKRLHLESVLNRSRSEVQADAEQINDVNGTLVFLRNSISLYENEGPVECVVARQGGVTGRVTVDYFTEDGTAVSGEDYVPKEGTLVFEDGQVQQSIFVDIVDNEVFEEDDSFMIYLTNAQGGATIGQNRAVQVIILNDDAEPTVEFVESTVYCYDEEADVDIKVRLVGATDLQTFVDFRTLDGSAKAGQSYEPTEGSLVFPSRGEPEQTIRVRCHNVNKGNGRDERFSVQLSNPKNARVGRTNIVTVTLVSDEGFSRMVDDVMAQLVARGKGLMLKNSSWSEQIKDSMTLGFDVDEHGNKLEPATSDYVMHFLTFFWKVIFATIPPTEIAGGWLTFVVSLIYIGAVTAIVGELASLFGCTVGLPDSITAITFVALGTSLPDTFASKQAAVQEDTADASVGNVTGSNSVNVFLGLGLPWTIATIYHAIDGSKFIVPGGSLGFSVAVFAVCAIICLFVLVLRRSIAGGALGGPRTLKIATTVLFLLLWLVYVLLSALQVTGALSLSV